MIKDCERCVHDRPIPERGPQVCCECLPAERSEIRNAQWERIFLPAITESKTQALAILWGYLAAAENRGVPVEATELLNLIVERLKGGAR